MITGKAWFKVPSAIKVELTGKLNPYVSGKDVILHLIGRIGVDGALYRSLEFTGDGVKSLSMDDRLCIANMAIEGCSRMTERCSADGRKREITRIFCQRMGICRWVGCSRPADGIISIPPRMPMKERCFGTNGRM